MSVRSVTGTRARGHPNQRKVSSVGVGEYRTLVRLYQLHTIQLTREGVAKLVERE